jgi:hypothetical protein
VCFLSYFASYYTVLKKIASILLITILFFNWYGYRLVTVLMEDKADQQLEAKLDNQEYDEAQLIEVRVALNVPYQNSSSEFERHYGEVEVDGKYYTYVKSKVENGFLVLQCIPNSSKEKIKSAGNDFFKMANGLDQQSDKKQTSNNNLAKNFWSEYDGKESEYTISIQSSDIKRTYPHNTSLLADICRQIPAQPPRQVALLG